MGSPENGREWLKLPCRVNFSCLAVTGDSVMLTCLHQPTPTSELSVGSKVSKSVKSGHISGCRTSGEVARGSKLNAAVSFSLCFETLARSAKEWIAVEGTHNLMKRGLLFAHF